MPIGIVSAIECNCWNGTNNKQKKILNERRITDWIRLIAGAVDDIRVWQVIRLYVFVVRIGA